MSNPFSQPLDAVRTAIAPSLAASALLLLGSLSDLSRTEGPSTPSAPAASRHFERWPLTIETWSGIDRELDSEQLRAAEAEEALVRSYIDAETGDVVVVTLLAGPPSVMAVHPPTACFRGFGFTQRDPVRSREFPSASETMASPPHRLHFTTFLPPSENGAETHIAWAWSSGGPWSTPTSPRLAFLGAPRLFKLYVSRERPLNRQPADSLDPAIAKFLTAALPIVASPASTGSTPGALGSGLRSSRSHEHSNRR